MARKEVSKNLHPIITFEKVDDEFTGNVKGVRKGVKTEFGECDCIDLTDDNGEIHSIFMGAALRLFDWNDLKGKNIALVYKGKVKNKGTKRTYEDYQVFELTPDKE